MRGVAALSVVCGHAVNARPDMVGRSLGEGALTILAGGVDIFFVISGFIIASTAAAQRDPLNFVFRRAVRIFPVYWLVLLVALASSSWIALSPGERPALDSGLIFAWTYPNWYIAPAWSIAFELHFYAAVAIILAVAPSRLFELLFAGLGMVMVAVALRLRWSWNSAPASASPISIARANCAFRAAIWQFLQVCSRSAGIGSLCRDRPIRNWHAWRPMDSVRDCSSMPWWRPR